MGWLSGIVTSVMGFFTAKQVTKTALADDQTVKDEKPNLLIWQMTAQIAANNFWLVALETQLTLIVIWNMAAYNFGWPLFKTQFDALQLLLWLAGVHVLKIGHKYSIK